MNIDVQQLELNVNLHAMQPEFRNLELQYVIAADEHTFRFADWQQLPDANEQKFYCFLQEKEFDIPAHNTTLKESYMLTQEPLYPVLTDCKDFLLLIKTVQQNGFGKAIGRFTWNDLETIKNDLKDEFEKVEVHLVASPELAHYIFVVDDIEISVAPTMVYFRLKTPFADRHYQSAKED